MSSKKSKKPCGGGNYNEDNIEIEIFRAKNVARDMLDAFKSGYLENIDKLVRTKTTSSMSSDYDNKHKSSSSKKQYSKSRHEQGKEVQQGSGYYSHSKESEVSNSSASSSSQEAKKSSKISRSQSVNYLKKCSKEKAGPLIEVSNFNQLTYSNEKDFKRNESKFPISPKGKFGSSVNVNEKSSGISRSKTSINKVPSSTKSNQLIAQADARIDSKTKSSGKITQSNSSTFINTKSEVINSSDASFYANQKASNIIPDAAFKEPQTQNEIYGNFSSQQFYQNTTNSALRRNNLMNISENFETNPSFYAQNQQQSIISEKQLLINQHQSNYMINPLNQAIENQQMQYNPNNFIQPNSQNNFVHQAISSQQNYTNSGPNSRIIQNEKKQPCAQNQITPISNEAYQQYVSNEATTNRPNSNMGQQNVRKQASTPNSFVQPNISNEHNYINSRSFSNMVQQNEKKQPCTQGPSNLNPVNYGYNNNPVPVYSQPTENSAKKPPCRPCRQNQQPQFFYPQNQQAPYQNQGQQFQQHGLPQENNFQQNHSFIPNSLYQQQQELPLFGQTNQPIPNYQQNQAYASNDIYNNKPGVHNMGQNIMPQQHGDYNNQGQFNNNNGKQPGNLRECPNSEMENELLNAENPLDLGNETGLPEINANGQSGKWANQMENDNWKGGPVPLDRYPINDDSNAQTVKKKPKNPVKMSQNVNYKFLKPPTPPPPGELTIKRQPDIQPPCAPPLILRVPPDPNDPRSKPPTQPIVLREKPPRAPRNIPPQTISIPGKILPPPPRKVIIEKLPPNPAPPPQLIVERWLDYPERIRNVVFCQETPINPEDSLPKEKPKNLIIEWEAPDQIIERDFNFDGVETVDPDDYVKQFSDQLIPSEELPSFVDGFELPEGEQLAADSSADKPPKLGGDLNALNLLDLDKHGLNQYESQIPQVDCDKDILPSRNCTQSGEPNKPTPCSERPKF